MKSLDENEKGLTVMKNDDERNHTASDITRALRVTPILPGENEELYKKGLKALISELEAKTVLQVYLAEKIFDCLWWIRRYEEQKRTTIIAEMASLVGKGISLRVELNEIQVREALLNNKIDSTTTKAVAAIGHTIPTLRQKAMERQRINLQQLDQQIALQSKILAGLQASFEVAFNRKLNTERLMLQNELLRKDLAAIDVTPTSSPHEKD